VNRAAGDQRETAGGVDDALMSVKAGSVPSEPQLQPQIPARKLSTMAPGLGCIAGGFWPDALDLIPDPHE